MEDMILYHYCGVETFLNIIKFHTLRLSDLCKSTDSLELKSLMETVEKEVAEQYRTNNDFLESIIYGMNMDDAFFIYIKNGNGKNEKEFRSNVIWSMFFIRRRFAGSMERICR